MTIHPTHTCFDDAVSNLIFLMKRDGRDAVRRGDLRIVHAIIHPPEEAQPMAHAWLETAAVVYFSGLVDGERVLVEVERAEYYAQSNVVKACRYTLFEAFNEERRSGHFGPWDPEIRPLCGRDRSGVLTFTPAPRPH